VPPATSSLRLFTAMITLYREQWILWEESVAPPGGWTFLKSRRTRPSSSKLGHSGSRGRAYHHRGKEGRGQGYRRTAPYLHDEPEGGATKQIILPVKGGGLKPHDVRDLRGVVDREKADIGVADLSGETNAADANGSSVSGIPESPGWKKTSLCTTICSVFYRLWSRPVFGRGRDQLPQVLAASVRPLGHRAPRGIGGRVTSTTRTHSDDRQNDLGVFVGPGHWPGTTAGRPSLPSHANDNKPD